jgi:hypothetical protein
MTIISFVRVSKAIPFERDRNTTVSFLQAGEAFPITILFKPRVSILTQCARFLEEEEGGKSVLKGVSSVLCVQCTGY